MNKITLVVLLAAMVACQPANQSQERPSSKPEAVIKDPDKIYSFMKEELPPIQINDQNRKRLEESLQQAKSDLEANPDSLELIIWYGRRQGYLGQYLEAIKTFSDGLTIYPSSYRLRRHRGHRYITTRQLDKAVEDFEMAAYHSINAENKIEHDGAPNTFNIPVSNDKFNIWYHFGLTYYLKGRYDKALSAYNKCMEFSDNNDLKVATTYWQYLTYKKLGNVELADTLLTDITGKMKLMENYPYLDLLLLFKEEKKPDQLLKKAINRDGSLNPTLAYGIASYFQHQGDLDRSNEVFLQIIETPNWNAFGYIASEAELKTIFPVP